MARSTLSPKDQRVHEAMLRLLALLDRAFIPNPKASNEACYALFDAMEAMLRRAMRKRRKAASTRYTTAQRRIWASYTPEQRAARVKRMRAGR